jgi:hypothetical protein
VIPGSGAHRRRRFRPCRIGSKCTGVSSAIFCFLLQRMKRFAPVLPSGLIVSYFRCRRRFSGTVRTAGACGKRREDPGAALMQRHRPVAERGRLHGPPELSNFLEHRVAACIRASCRSKVEKRKWLGCRGYPDRLRRQDKRPQGVALSWWCFSARYSSQISNVPNLSAMCASIPSRFQAACSK